MHEQAGRQFVDGARTAALNFEARRALGGLLPLLDEPDLRDLTISVVDDARVRGSGGGRGGVGAGGGGGGGAGAGARAGVDSVGGVGRLWADFGGRLRQLDWQAEPPVVRALAVALIAAGGRQLDELNPCANVRIGDGIRVHAMLPPVSVTGAAISIRVPRIKPLSFFDLVSSGFCTGAVAKALQRAVQEKRNLLIVGGTGSGKTTALAALLDLAPAHERIITIEDVAELRLTHPHWVALEARPPNSEGTGEMSLDRLLREALRMRPDRIVLGECRGPELLTLLMALNTGHEGGAGTLHANGLAEVPARLEALGALAGLPSEALARQVQSALHLVVSLERTPTGQHRVAELGRFRFDGQTLQVETLRVETLSLEANADEAAPADLRPVGDSRFEPRQVGFGSFEPSQVKFGRSEPRHAEPELLEATRRRGEAA